jgi:hypothetical protein
MEILTVLSGFGQEKTNPIRERSLKKQTQFIRSEFFWGVLTDCVMRIA